MTEQERLRIFDYLLGRGSDRDAIGDRYFSDAGFAEELDAAEREMLDRHVRGHLSLEDSALLERQYSLSDVQRRKLAFAQTLAALARRRSPSKIVRILAPLAVAALILLTWFASTHKAPQGPPRVTVARIEPPALQSVPGPRPPVRAQDVLLAAGVSRGGGYPSVRVANDVEALNFHLELRQPVSSAASAKLEGPDGAVWSGSDLKNLDEAGSPVLVLTVPTAKLNPGRYTWNLTSGERFGFQLVRK